MADVFISYKSARRPAIRHLARVLEAYGYSVWFDHELISGRDFSGEIERQLRAAKATIVVWCTLSKDSEWVRNEASLAKELGSFLPVWLEKVSVFPFRNDDTIDLTGWDGEPASHDLDRLLNQIRLKVGRKPQSDYDRHSELRTLWRDSGKTAWARMPMEKDGGERRERAWVNSRAEPSERASPVPGNRTSDRPEPIREAAKSIPETAPERWLRPALAGAGILIAGAIIAFLTLPERPGPERSELKLTLPQRPIPTLEARDDEYRVAAGDAISFNPESNDGEASQRNRFRIVEINDRAVTTGSLVPLDQSHRLKVNDTSLQFAASSVAGPTTFYYTVEDPETATRGKALVRVTVETAPELGARREPLPPAPVFSFYAPGALLPGTGIGFPDQVVHAPGMVFPIKSAPAYLQSQVFSFGGGVAGGDQCDARNYTYPWRDNFCETRTANRSSPFCPTSKIHQGQDIRVGTAADCNTMRRQAAVDRGLHEVVAVEDGFITSISTYNVKLRSEGRIYNYMHLNMNRLAVSAGQSVKAGDLLGYVSNDFGGTPTTLHLHFEIVQNTAAHGWVHVAPYMSLVAAYARRENGPGLQLQPENAVDSANVFVIPEGYEIIE